MPATHCKIFYLITKSNWGGAQRYVYDLATALLPDQFDATVIFGPGGTLAEKLTAAGIKTITLSSLGRDVKPLSDFATFRQLYRLFQTERPDIIHLNSSKIGALGALAGRLAGIKKIIFTGHGWAFNEKRSRLNRLLIGLIHWLTITLAHQTIAVSEKTARQISHLPLVKEKITIIHNGLATISYLEKTLARQALIEKVWQKEISAAEVDKFTIIGTVSELHKNKGVDFLIQAFGEIKDQTANAVIWIIGEGEERKSLEQQIKNNNCEESIFLLGAIPNAAHYIKAFDIFTLTSRTEAFPYAVLEAGAASLPIIASAVGGIPEMIDKQGENGILVRSGNIRELKYTLLKLLKDQKLRTKLGKNISKKITKDFSLEKMVKETISLYKN